MTAYRPTFISHAHADNELCDRYAAALRARRIDVWYDRDNAQAGHFLGDEIQRELEQRPAFVLLMTQAALDSFWVKLELQAFLGLMGRDAARFLLPVRIGPCTVPPLLNGLLWVDALAMPFEKAIDAIATALALTDATSAPQQSHTMSPPSVLPPLGPAPAPFGASSAHHLTPMSLYNLGFRGYTKDGVEFILPPLCPVPGGVFIMGSDKRQDKEAQDDETPQHPVEVRDFAIGQHPVTVAEYACAVRAKAVREPLRREDWGIVVDWQKQLKRPNHPIVCVTWQDTLAYVRWLAQTTGQLWHLPTEAEWEKAARWDPQRQVGRIYPWGGRFDKARCNTAEGGVAATTPVGHYANGASPCGAQDMAGNVWEWTSSLRRPYPYRRDDGREDLDFFTSSRVLRGGSWRGVAGDGDARTAYRLRGWMGLLDNRSGFRLAFAPAGA